MWAKNNDYTMAVGGRLPMKGNVYAKAGPLNRKPTESFLPTTLFFFHWLLYTLTPVLKYFCL